MKRATLLGAVLTFLLVWPSVAQGAAELGTLQQITLTSEQHASLQALKLFRMSPEGSVTRLLVVSPTGSRLVLTDVVRPREGTITSTFLDEGSNWWAQSEVQMESANTLSEFLAVNAHPMVEPEAVHLQTSEGEKWEDFQLIPEDQEGSRYPAQRLRSQVEKPRYTLDLPPDVAASILLLNEIIGTASEPSRPGRPASAPLVLPTLVSALAASANLDSHAEPPGWEIEERRVQRFQGIGDPGLLEFVARFTTVENADPLSDFRTLIATDTAADPQLLEP
jgi:hypothetical protein